MILGLGCIYCHFI